MCISVSCKNVCKTCRRLGELLRQEQERLHKMKMEGHTIYMEYAQKGRDAKVIKQVSSILLLLLVCISCAITGQAENSVFICRV